jgi:hypothetical protein
VTTGYDVAGMVPCTGPDGGCGQPLPNHLPICPALATPAVPPATLEAVEDMEHKLGEAI